MATCKDCFHYEACADMLRAMGLTVDGPGLDADKRCPTFTSAEAIKILIARSVCCSPDLTCSEYCPYADVPGGCKSWDLQKADEAVKQIQGGNRGT